MPKRKNEYKLPKSKKPKKNKNDLIDDLIEILPNEMILHMIKTGNLTSKDLIALSKTNKRLYNLISDDSIRKEVCKELKQKYSLLNNATSIFDYIEKVTTVDKTRISLFAQRQDNDTQTMIITIWFDDRIGKNGFSTHFRFAWSTDNFYSDKTNNKLLKQFYNETDYPEFLIDSKNKLDVSYQWSKQILKNFFKWFLTFGKIGNYLRIKPHQNKVYDETIYRLIGLSYMDSRFPPSKIEKKKVYLHEINDNYFLAPCLLIDTSYNYYPYCYE